MTEVGASAQPWRGTLALFMAGFATFSLIYSAQPLLPQLAHDFRLSAAASSWALSATTVTLAVSILVAGALSETFGRKALMFTSMCAASVLNLACAMAPTWPALLLGRAFEGFALGGVPSVAMAYITEETPPERLGSAMGLYVSGAAFGGMTGRVAIGALSQVAGWRGALGVVSALDLVAALAFLALLPPSRHFVRRGGMALTSHLTAWHRRLRQPGLVWLYLVGFLAMGAFVSVYNYIGFRLVGPPYRLNQAEAGLIFFAYLSGMAASPWAGSLADRFGRAPILTLGAAIALVGLGISLAEPLPCVILGVVAVTIGFFIAHSVASGWVGALAGDDRSHAASLYLLAYYLGGSLLGSVGGLFWRQGGWPGVTLFSGAAMLGVLVAGVSLGFQRARG